MSKYFLIFIFAIFILNEKSFSESIFFEENKLLSKYFKEKDEKKKELLSEELKTTCPFKEVGSSLSSIIPNAISLNLSENMSSQKKAECQKYLNEFNDSIDRSSGLKEMIAKSKNTFADQEKQELENKLETTMTASSSLSDMLKSKCEFDNSAKDISNISNHLTDVIESGSAALYLVNPFAAIIGSSAAAIGRLGTSIGRWIFGTNKNELTNEANESENYVSDLCSFRELAYKFDESYIDPTEIKKFDEEDFNKKEMEINKAEGLMKTFQDCLNSKKNSNLKLEEFSEKINKILAIPIGQSQCLEFLNLFLDDEKNGKAFKKISDNYNCFTSVQNTEMIANAFCKNYDKILELSKNDIYEKCENQKFQTELSAKLLNVSDIVFKNVTNKANETKLSKTEKEMKKQLQEDLDFKKSEYEALNLILKSNSITSSNSVKSMTNLGRNILGVRFDKYSENALDSADKKLDEVMDVVDELKDKNDDIYNPGIFSFKKSINEKLKLKDELCKEASTVKVQISTTFSAYNGLKDICSFMKGSGVPELKNKGFDFDIYSAPISEKENNFSSRCQEIEKEIKEKFTELNKQVQIVDSFKCQK